MNDERIDDHVYYKSKGVAMRQKAPGSIGGAIEIWRPKERIWEAYHDRWDFWHTASRIAKEKAQELTVE